MVKLKDVMVMDEELIGVAEEEVVMAAIREGMTVTEGGRGGEGRMRRGG